MPKKKFKLLKLTSILSVTGIPFISISCGYDIEDLANTKNNPKGKNKGSIPTDEIDKDEPNNIYTPEKLSEADTKAIEKLKETANEKLDLFTGKDKIEKLGVSNDEKIENIAKLAKTLEERIRKTTNEVYEKYGSPSDTRYKRNLECYENFMNNFLTSSDSQGGVTGMYSTYVWNQQTFMQELKNYGLLEYFTNIYNQIATTNDSIVKQQNELRIKERTINYSTGGISQSANHFEYIFNQISEYLDDVDKDLSLVFNKKDGYAVDFEKLDFLNPDKIGKVSDHLTKEQIIEYRKKLLNEGSLIDETKKPISVSYDDFSDMGMINYRDLIYDITGGSNYYNDVTMFYSGISQKPHSNSKKYSLDIKYRTNPTEQQKQETVLNEFVANKITDIVSVKMTDKQKVTAVHNWITDNMDYADNNLLRRSENDDYWSREIRNPYRFISNPNTASIVCEAYARMFQRFMTFLDIPSWYIGGDAKPTPYERSEGHAWNMVLIDGKQYYVDCTWDDPNVHPQTNKHQLIHKSIRPHKYDYLLKTWDEIAGEDSMLRTIHNDTLALYYLRTIKAKDFWDIEYIKTQRGKTAYENVKSRYQ